MSAVRLDLRPMDLGEILDRTFRLYRAHFMTFFLIMLAVQAISFLGSLTCQASLAPLQPSPGTALHLPGMSFFVALFFSTIVTFLAAQVGIGTLTTAVSSIYLGEPIGIGEAVRRVRPSLGRLLGTTLLTSLIIVLGMVACVVPGFYFLLSYLLVSQVVVIEGLGPQAAMRRSSELMRKKSDKGLFRNNIMKASVILIIVFVLAAAAGMIVGLPFGIAQILTADRTHPPSLLGPMHLLQSTLTMIVQAGVAPIGTIAMILFYYDIRIRKEGFDLQMLASALGVEPVPPVHT
jgi:hypothetical protein